MSEKWFCYDDHLVSELDPTRVCTPDAYILFYRRREGSSSSEPLPKSPSSQQQEEQQQQPPPLLAPPPSIDSITNDFDEQLNLDYSPNLQSPTIEENLIRPKPPQYILQPPLPLPRKFLTPLPSSSSQEDFPSVPCPMPRMRRTQYALEIAPPSPAFLPPSTITRRLPMTPTNDFVYPIASTPLERVVEPMNDYYSLNSRLNHAERSNPWNRYNSQRYSDDEQERHVVYPMTILR